MIDGISIRFYCGDVMDTPTKEQIKMFGKPTCCGYGMVPMDREKIFAVVKSLDKLKKNLEEQILKGMM